MNIIDFSELYFSDPDLTEALNKEQQRQEQHIELIASENYASPQVLAVQSSVLTNKYAEGYPQKRYYGGCDHADAVEQLAIDRAKRLFSAHFANVQPHSGASANAAVFLALLKPNDLVMGMDLNAGGHLTHGSEVNFSGKIYRSVSYGINDSGWVDYDEVRDLARKHQPKMLIGGFSAYSRRVEWNILREIADEVGAYFLVDMAHVAGLVATKLYPDPLRYAHVVTTTTHKTLRGPRGGLILTHDQPGLDKKINSAIFPGMQGGPLMHIIAAKAMAFREALRPEFRLYQHQVIDNARVLAEILQERGLEIVSGGTDNHLMLVSLMKRGITGKAADAALGSVNITVNKNAVPKDPQSPFITSGIRLGTPAGTTRGFDQSAFRRIGNWIADILENPENAMIAERVREGVADLCQTFPVYADKNF